MTTIAESLTHVVTKKSFEVESCNYVPSGELGVYYPLVTLRNQKALLKVGDVYAYHFFSRFGTVDHYFEVVAKTKYTMSDFTKRIAWRCNKLTNLEVLAKIGGHSGTK